MVEHIERVQNGCRPFVILVGIQRVTDVSSSSSEFRKSLNRLTSHISGARNRKFDFIFRLADAALPEWWWFPVPVGS